MAKVKLNPVLEQFRGKVGDLVFRRYEGKVIVARMADQPEGAGTDAQVAHRERFRQAAGYGRTVFADAVLRAVYDVVGKTRRIPTFAVAVSDYLKAPIVEAIDASGYTGKAGESIVVRASDDFEVVDMLVAIRVDTEVVEQGNAVLDRGLWRYNTTVASTRPGPFAIDAIAIDRPGNRTTRTEVKA